MKDEARLLEDKFTEILNWERAKRREASLLWSFCYAVVSSLIALPVSGLIAPGVNPMWFPVVFFGGLALARLLLNPWSRADSAKALLRLDKSLALEERAITAWDILGRKTPRPAERLVLEEAWQKLETADPKLVLRRDPGWTAAAAPLLLVVWLFAAWFQDELSIKAFSGGSQAASVAQSAKEYARSLQQKSKAEGLRESLKAARALEELAEKRLRRESGERAFLDSLSQLMKGVEARAGSPSYEAAAHLAAPTRQGLADLRSEIESLRESLKFPGGVGGDGKLGSEVLERLAGLPQLRKEVETAFKQGKKPES